jgi:4-carboxymuconolactone decarboxylase
MATRWGNREERLQDARDKYHDVMTTPAPDPTCVYYDAGVVGFVFGEMWSRSGLTRRDRRWITLTCVGASDTLVPIQTHVYAALNSGDCTLEEMQEFNLHYATQMGWPKAQIIDQTIGTAVARIAQERGTELPQVEIVRWTDPGDEAERRARGRAAYEDIMLAPAPEPETVFRGLGYLDYLYGEIWTRPVLTRKERRIISICSAAVADADRDAAAHAYAALKSGDLTFDEIQELVLHYAVYLGWLSGSKLDDTVVTAWERVQSEGSPAQVQDSSL